MVPVLRISYSALGTEHVLNSRIEDAQQTLERNLTPEDFQRVNKLCRDAAEKTFDRTRQDHLRKLGKLTRKKTINLRPQGLERWVINRTQRTLTEAQTDVLRLGLNFAPAADQTRSQLRISPRR